MNTTQNSASIQPENPFSPANSTKQQPSSAFSTHSLVMMAMFAAVLCISAYISITLPNGLHITFLNFIVTLIALLFPSTQAVCIIVLWLLMGILGIPVFVGGNAGIGYLLSPKGGYSVSFLVIALLLPLTLGKKYNRIRYTIMSILSVIVVNLIGSAWLWWWSKTGSEASPLSFSAALIAGFLPFIVLDVIKAVIAAQIVPAFRKIMYR